jgi:enolase
MEDKVMIVIENSDGSRLEVELITYLYSKDGFHKYVVYSKGEKSGPEEDEIIYVSKLIQEGDTLVIEEILDDNEWAEVQKLLKEIANAA